MVGERVGTFFSFWSPSCLSELSTSVMFSPLTPTTWIKSIKMNITVRVNQFLLLGETNGQLAQQHDSLLQGGKYLKISDVIISIVVGVREVIIAIVIIVRILFLSKQFALFQSFKNILLVLLLLSATVVKSIILLQSSSILCRYNRQELAIFFF